jgi:large subunit ribosomal protein L24
MRRLQVGDEVVVIRGNYKDHRGKIARVLPEKEAVVVEGVNQVKRHIKATPQRPGGILEVEAPLHWSKVMLVDPETGKRTRVRFQTTKSDEGHVHKMRIAKSGAVIPRKVETTSG